jgi:hypothetical protein
MLKRKTKLNELEPTPQSIIAKDFYLKDMKIKVFQEEEEKDVNNINNIIKKENELQITSKNSINFIYKKRGRKKNISIPTDSYTLIHDKYCDDNIKRKVKTHYHNFIVAFVNMKANHILENNNKFGKISFDITQNITVEYNQKLFEKKIKDIIINVSDKYNNKDKNKNALNIVMKNANENSDIMKILNLTYKDLYLNYYLKSTKKLFEGESEDESYEEHLLKLEKKFGNKYALEYKRNAENLIQFFYICKKRVRKRKSHQAKEKRKEKENENEKENKKELIPPSIINISQETNEILCYDNSNYYTFEKVPKYLISTCTQTNNNYISDDEDEY